MFLISIIHLIGRTRRFFRFCNHLLMPKTLVRTPYKSNDTEIRFTAYASLVTPSAHSDVCETSSALKCFRSSNMPKLFNKIFFLLSDKNLGD